MWLVRLIRLERLVGLFRLVRLVRLVRIVRLTAREASVAYEFQEQRKMNFWIANWLVTLPKNIIEGQFEDLRVWRRG